MTLTLKHICFILLFYFVSFIDFRNLEDTKFSIHFFDVGQGDSTFFFFRAGDKTFRMLIDGGGDYSSLMRFPKHYLPGNCFIDVVVLTHPHLDHLGGLSRILEYCSVRHVTFNDVTYDSKAFERFKAQADNIGTNNSLEFSTLPVKDLSIHILWPDPSVNIYDISNVNDQSIVTLVTYAGYAILSLGDIESLYQSHLVAKLNSMESFGSVRIIKIAHHGAENGYNADVVRAFSPHYCVISVGEKNKYGHPSSRVVAALQDIHGCKVMRTDELGTIVFPLKEFSE